MAQPAQDGTLEVRISPAGLFGLLGVPSGAQGVVLFAHGSGSGRHSPRNNAVARALRQSGMATLLLDLLTPAEESDRRNVFDIPLLAARLLTATDWVVAHRSLAGLPIGYFGASTGAGAALVAAAERGDDLSAVVSRGGRPDLAEDALEEVRAPTLLIVGGRDGPVIDLNRAAQSKMRTEVELVVVPGAGHLFEEPGALDQVILHARRWFLGHFVDIEEPETRHDSPPAGFR